MPRVEWPLRIGRPCLHVVLTQAPGGQPLSRVLLADTGAGSQTSPFQFVLTDADCLLCDGIRVPSVMLRGAFTGTFPTYDILVRIPAIGFNQRIRVVGVPSAPPGFDGIACFAFLNRFTYGNFGNPGQFGLEL